MYVREEQFSLHFQLISLLINLFHTFHYICNGAFITKTNIAGFAIEIRILVIIYLIFHLSPQAYVFLGTFTEPLFIFKLL